MSKPVAQFFMKMLNAGTVAHILHLQSRSYAQHMALNELYEAMPGLADDLIEAWQGKYGIVSSYPATIEIAKDPLSFITELSSYIDANKDLFEADSEIVQLVDNIADQVDSTMYKLKFLS